MRKSTKTTEPPRRNGCEGEKDSVNPRCSKKAGVGVFNTDSKELQRRCVRKSLRGRSWLLDRRCLGNRQHTVESIEVKGT